MGRNDTITECNIIRLHIQSSERKDGNVITNLDRPLLNGEDISDAPNLPPGEDLDVDTGLLENIWETVEIPGL